MKLVKGMRVRLQPEARRSRKLRDEEFTVLKVAGTGYDTFVKLSGPEAGELQTWVQWRELAIPAHRQTALRRTVSGQPAESLLARAHQLVADTDGSLQLSDALKKAAREDPAAAAHHLESFRGSVSEGPVTPQAHPISLHRHDTESFTELVERVAREKRLDYASAVRLAARAYPALAHHYSARR